MKLDLLVFIQEINLYLFTKDVAYVKNLDKYKSIGTHWIDLYLNGGNVKHLAMQDTLITLELMTPKEIKKFISNKNITTNIFGIQAHNLIMCEYFCIGFIGFMLQGKSFVRLCYFIFV